MPARTGRLAGHAVDRVGYGAMQLEFRNRADGPDRPRARSVLRRAVELGVNHIDTAQFYGAGLVNELIRDALHPYSADLVLATKVGADHRGGGLVAAQRPAELRASVEANLRSLAAERLDVVYLRRVDAPPGIVATGDQIVDLDDQLGELVAMREAGMIGAIGLSHVSVEQLQHARAVGIASVQNLYNLLDRSAQPLLDECRAHDIAFVPYFPLGSGFSQLEKVTDLPAVRAVAERLAVAPSQVGLAWVLAQDPCVLLIPGTTSEEHLIQNLAAGDIELDDETLAELDAATT